MKYFIFLLLVSLCFSYVSATCWGGRAPENATASSMSTCCWYESNTCCAANNVTSPLDDIQESLQRLVRLGLSSKCYNELANLECSLCSPQQAEYITYGGFIDGDDSDDDFDNQRWIFRICEDFCGSLFKHCSDTTDAALLGANVHGSATDFCESIDGGELVNDAETMTGIFGGASFLVSQFNCFQGVSTSVIEENIGVCLSSVNELLIITPESSSSVILRASMILAIVIALLF